MWRRVNSVLSQEELNALRKEADALQEIEAPNFENGCVLETLNDAKINVDDDTWRVDAETYFAQRKVNYIYDSSILQTLACFAAEDLCASSQIWLFNEQYVVKPAQSAINFRWHRDRDEQCSWNPELLQEKPAYLSCWIPLDDCDEYNGCLETESGPIHCQAGDLILLDADCWHRSGPNLSMYPRRVFYVQFSAQPILVHSHPLRLAIGFQTSLLTSYLKQVELGHIEKNDYDSMLSASWEAMHHSENNNWRKVNPIYRRIFALAALSKVDNYEISAQEKIKVLDLALMMSDGTHRSALISAIKKIEIHFSVHKKSLPSQINIASANEKVISRTASNNKIALCNSAPSVHTFATHYFNPRIPVRIRFGITSWPALKKWSDLNYLIAVAGHRIVPIERGDHYLDPNFDEELMPLSDFIHNFICKNNPNAYLAQHALFDQIPQLRNDLGLPDYCCALSDLNDDDQTQYSPRLNAWFGPAGTKSPLHHDRYHNLFVQIFGSKYIRLYSPDQTSKLYPRNDIHAVSSQVANIDHVDQKKFPLFHQAQYQDCILEPGDMLYIPPGTWHYIESHSVSFSVSYWWL